MDTSLPWNDPLIHSVTRDPHHIGHTVENGLLRFLSVSQIKNFWFETDGCPRRWAFEKVFGKKPEKTAAQAAGNEFATALEHYLKTGVDALKPELRVGKHLLPAPGPDLEIEVELGDRLEAARLRDEYLRTSNYEDRARLGEAMKIIAGLTTNNIPLIGAADYRHRRGVFVDEGGTVRPELPGYRVVEIGDHKTTARINDYASRSGKIYQGYAKSVDQILNDVQMVGYAVNSHNRYPDATHARLSHNYYQTKNGHHAEKRSGLISMENAVRWWEETVDPIAREMEDVAKVKTPDEAPVNLRACRAFNRDCQHAPYCNRPEGSVKDLFQIKKGDEMTQGLFGQMGTTSTPTTNGVHATTTTAPAPAAQQGLFGAMNTTAPSAPVPPTAPPAMSDAERQAAIDAAKAKLVAEMSTSPADVAAAKTRFQSDQIRYDAGSKQMYDKNGADNGWLVRDPSAAEMIAYQQLTAPAISPPPPPAVFAPPPPPPVVAAPPPPPPMAMPHTGSINPPDMPAPDPVAAAVPLTPEAIATITDPQVRKIAEDHAAAAAARAAEAAAANPGTSTEKTTGRCPAGGEKVQLTPAQAGTKKINCPRCNKELRLKAAEIAADFSTGLLPGHIMQKTMAAAPAPAPVAAAPAAAPPPPVAFVPPPPPPPAAPFTSVVEAAVPAPVTVASTSYPPVPPDHKGVRIYIENDDGTKRLWTTEEMDAVAAGAPAKPIIPAPRASIDHDLRQKLQKIVGELQEILK